MKFDAQVEYVSDGGERRAITVGKNDVTSKRFDPADPRVDGMSVGVSDRTIKRFIEDQADHKTIVYSGYAERVGFPIPEPGKMQIGGKVLTPIGKLRFRQKYMGKFFGIDKWGASWMQEYSLDEVPEKVVVHFELAVDATDPKDVVDDSFAGPSPGDAP